MGAVRRRDLPQEQGGVDHAKEALYNLERAERFAERSRGRDGAILPLFATAGIQALLAIADELRGIRKHLAPGFAEADVVDAAAVVDQTGEEHTYPAGSTGLCMASYVGRPGATTEYCSRPDGHEGLHSWEANG